MHADGVNAQDVLEKGLRDLVDLCDVVIEKFETAKEDFGNRMTE
jgi:DNA-directed RNA polymerase I and III subunit RPAC2